MEKIKVIFKKDNNEIVAIFPYELGTFDSNGYYYATCYAHIGQHSSCGYDYGVGLPTAKPSEYADLLKELKSIGYKDLQILKRMPSRRYIYYTLKKQAKKYDCA